MSAVAARLCVIYHGGEGRLGAGSSEGLVGTAWMQSSKEDLKLKSQLLLGKDALEVKTEWGKNGRYRGQEQGAH